jgi:hypothetical protein
MNYEELVRQGVMIPVSITDIAETIIEIDVLIATLKRRRRRLVSGNGTISRLVQLELDRLRS